MRSSPELGDGDEISAKGSPCQLGNRGIGVLLLCVLHESEAARLALAVEHHPARHHFSNWGEERV